MVPALIKAGLPLTSVELFLTALSSGNAATIAKVPGVNEKIIGVGATYIKLAYQKAFKIVYLSSLAFGGLAIIAAWWTPSVEDRVSHNVVRRLDGGRHQKAAAEDLESKAQPAHDEEA